MIAALKNLQYEDRLRELKICNLEDRRVSADLIKSLRLLQNCHLSNLKRFFVLDNK